MNAKMNGDPLEETESLKEQPLITHLVELRDRMLRAAAAVIIVFLSLVYWANDIYMFIAVPLTSNLDLAAGDGMITTRPLDSFLVPFKLTFMVAVFICIPYVLHQAWAFISPGLYKNEIRVTLPIIISSVMLFYAGIAFSYFVILGYVFEFFVGIAPENVTVATDIAYYVDFVTGLFLAFGLVFEIPVAMVLLVISGVAPPAWFVEKRSYAIIANFAVAMIVTPQDPYSMIMMGVPMCLLYETGILAGRCCQRSIAMQKIR